MKDGRQEKKRLTACSVRMAAAAKKIRDLRADLGAEAGPAARESEGLLLYAARLTGAALPVRRPQISAEYFFENTEEILDELDKYIAKSKLFPSFTVEFILPLCQHLNRLSREFVSL